jgi:hypothetical protein
MLLTQSDHINSAFDITVENGRKPVPSDLFIPFKNQTLRTF